MGPLIIAAAAGAGLSIIGNLQARRAQRAAAGLDAQYEEAAASVALQDGLYESWMRESKGSQETAAAAAAVAAGGVDSSSGSAAGVVENVALMSAIDAARIRLSAQRVAWTHKQRAEAARYAAKEDWMGDILSSLAIGSNFGFQAAAIGKKPNVTASPGPV